MFRSASWHGRPARLAAIRLHENLPGEPVLDLAMARHGLEESRLGIPVPVVLGTVPDQHTARPLDSPNRRGPFHATGISVTLRIPGSAPLVRSL